MAKEYYFIKLEDMTISVPVLDAQVDYHAGNVHIKPDLLDYVLNNAAYVDTPLPSTGYYDLYLGDDYIISDTYPQIRKTSDGHKILNSDWYIFFNALYVKTDTYFIQPYLLYNPITDTMLRDGRGVSTAKANINTYWQRRGIFIFKDSSYDSDTFFVSMISSKTFYYSKDGIYYWYGVCPSTIQADNTDTGEIYKILFTVSDTNDPYADGGASDTGGGGGSFDGTTEIINEPDSPLVNISNTHFVSLYNPTESQIKSLSNYMWNTLAIENWRKIVADPMDAIISLAVLPIDVPSSGTREIYVGAFSTGIACNVASAQYISFDCGTILIPQYSNSYLDYAPYTDISIYIPYVGLRSLPCDAIMGKTIGLKYRIDIFSGACVVYLTVNGSVLLQFTGNCAQPIPFTSQSWGTAVTNAISMVASGASMIAMPATAPLAIANMASTAVNGGFKADITKGGGSGGNTGFLGVQKPYVIIQRPVQCIPANQNTFTGYPSYITATFGDLKGYTEVDKIILENINATESELNELESILKGGVYVNEL